MESFVSVGNLDQFPVGQGRILSVARKPVAIFNVGGTLYAVNNICPHLGGPLGAGRLQGRVVTCPYHRMAFDVTTGESTDEFGHRVQSYDVRVSDDEVFVEAWWVKDKGTGARR
jgi:nitrite reductase/ring-hydroxylating ferredoxin subunit